MSAITGKELPVFDANDEAFSAKYRDPIWTSIFRQSVVTVVAALISDHGFTLRMWAATLIAFWIGAAVILIRRPETPAESDLHCLKIAFIPLLFEAMLIGGAIVAIRAGSWHM